MVQQSGSKLGDHLTVVEELLSELVNKVLATQDASSPSSSSKREVFWITVNGGDFGTMVRCRRCCSAVLTLPFCGTE